MFCFLSAGTCLFELRYQQILLLQQLLLARNLILQFGNLRVTRSNSLIQVRYDLVSLRFLFLSLLRLLFSNVLQLCQFLVDD